MEELCTSIHYLQQCAHAVQCYSAEPHVMVSTSIPFVMYIENLYLLVLIISIHVSQETVNPT